MALALTREHTDLDDVAEACRQAYAANGEIADVMTWNRLFLGETIVPAPPTPTVVARSTKTIECILPTDADPGDYLSGFRRMVFEDWTVRLLVHSARMGEAHRSLRGSPVTLQPWWHDGGSVHFGRPEIP